jgi:short subunit dehydrogenase-like uncharacterized protein
MVARELRARGLPVRGAARGSEKLAELEAELPGIETVVADVAEPESLVRAAEGCTLLISSVGPYAMLGEPALLAALTHGIPYIDIAGEPAWLARVFGEFSEQAEAAGTFLLPAFGYDYVPGNLAGAVALRECGERAVRVDIGYCLAGENERSTKSFSQGTLDSLEASRRAKPFAFVGGALRELDGPRRKHVFAIDNQEVSTVAIGASEHFALPRLAPWLEEVNVGLGWFSPGEGRVEEGSGAGEGPSEDHRRRARARVVAQAIDASGEVICRVDVDGPNPYDMSGLLCAWGAQQIAAGAVAGTGALGPVDAFGLAQLETGCAELGITARVI